jgi:8-oxo-dGTP pyrophosphatase MutT (NUDIX family)
MAKALIAANRPTAPDHGLGGFGATSAAPGQTSPLVQSYAAWTSGALPRDPATFMTGSFGPLSPMQPVPIDTPNPDTDRTDPRRWQYTPGWNIPHGTPGDEGLKLASFANLRTISDTYSVARACIQLRKDELLGLGWDVVPTKAAEKAMRGDRAKRQEFDKRRARMVTFWKRPDQQYFSFRDWFSVLLEEVLVTDALSLYLWPARAKGKGVMGSNLSQLASIDGSTIRPLLDVHGGTPLPPNPGFQQYLYGVPRSDLVTMHTGEDVAGMGDALTREYQADQLIYRPQTPRNWTPYGFAPIERALVPILSGIQRQQFQLNYFSEGSIPGLFVSAGDPNATPSQLRELQDALNAMAGDPGWKHKIIVLPQGSRTDPQRPAELAGTFDEIIMTQVCMAFSVMPMELGISPRTSSSQSNGAANQMAKTSQDTQQRKGNIPLLEWFADIFNHVIQGVCGQDDMQWWWEGLDTGEDEEKKVNIQKARISVGLMSIDEGRIEDGKQPWGLPTTSDPVLITATGVIPFGQIDPKTGLPVGHPEQQQGLPGAPGGPAAGPTPTAGPKPPPKPKPAPGGGTAATPAHAAAQSNEAATASAKKPAPAGSPKKTDEPKLKPEPESATKKPVQKVDTFAALRELDLLRRRIIKGRGLDDWTVEHLPADLFATLDGTSVSIDRARTAVKGIGLRQRREEAVGAGQQLVVDGLRQLAAGLEAGTVATPVFVDAAVDVLRGGIRSGLGAGAGHALADLGHRSPSPVTKYAASYNSRFFQYADAVKSGYEAGRGLTTIATGDGKWLARWDTTSARPCDLCKERNGHTYEIGTIPGYPGMGGFGPGATVCRGGTNCKCEITYIHTPDADPAPDPQQVAARRAMAAAMPALVKGADSVATDPDAYEEFLDGVAETMAEQQRPYLSKLLRDLLNAGSVAATPLSMARGAVSPSTVVEAGTAVAIAGQVHSQQEAAPVTKHAGHADLTHEVYAYLARQYPADVLEWVKDAHWHAPETVALADIDMARRPGGARDQDKVDSIEGALDAGYAVHPIVLVRTPAGLPYHIADGYHRTAALAHAGKATVEAYIGDVTSDDGPWGAQMNRAKLTKAEGPDAAGIAVQAKDTGRVLMLQRAVDPTDRAGGLWEFPGGRREAGEDPEKAARREFTEETGLKVPDGKITGTWTSPNGVYRGFVLRVKHEADVDVFGERDAAVNPDDPDGDHVEALAWWDPRQLHDNPSVRGELAADIAHVLYVLHPPEVEKGQRYRHGWIPIAPEDRSRSWDSIEKDYGGLLDSADFQDDGASVGAHEDGSVVIVFPGLREQHWDDFAAMTADGARDMADHIEKALDLDHESTPPSPNGLVDWTLDDDGALYGVDEGGDIRIGVPSSDGRLDETDLSRDDAQRLADGLRDMADVAGEQ